ncbi:MAG: hypothetical protein JST91_28660 [Actinobacteria bacterium]|nr:hypothetical protein [Actinomycetota bacterium]
MPDAVPEPPVKGLAIAAGARRPGAKKPTAAPAQPAPVASPDGDEALPPAVTSPQPTESPDEPEPTPVKGLGLARGARPPGRRR